MQWTFINLIVNVFISFHTLLIYRHEQALHQASMPHKDLATIRIANLDPHCQRSELLHFLDNGKAKKAAKVSLCPSSSLHGATLTATVTFRSNSGAKQALSLNGRVLRERNVSIDRDFMGLTVLAAPQDAVVE